MKINQKRGSKRRRPILLARFERIKIMPNICPLLNEFHYTFTKKYRRQCFEGVKQAFLFAFDKQKVKKFLLLESKFSQDSRRKYLKKIRRLGLVLRAIYHFFDKTHKCPKNLHKFLSSLGRFNDGYRFSGVSEMPNVCLIDSRDINLNSASSKAVRKHALGLLSQIEKSLERTEFSAQEFHSLRKNIRLCADLLQVSAAENYGGNLHWLFASLLSLSVELGNKHDKLVLQDLRAKAEYRLSKVIIDKTFPRRFKEIEPFIKKVLGLS